MTEPSRTAAIGSILVARIAGRRLASTAISVPTPRLIKTVLGAKTSVLLGSSIPAAARSFISPTAIPSPRNSPASEPMTPMATDSSTTDPSTCRRDAPRVRRVASSRIRWATVIASVFAITKLPTNSAIPPNPIRMYLITLMSSCVDLLSAAACASALLTWVVSERSGVIWRTSSGSVVPGSAATRITSSRPTLSNTRRPVSRSKTVIDAPPIESTEPKPTMPAIRYFATGPSARTPTVWPISKPCFSAVDLSIAISPSPRGHSPVTSLNGFMVWSAEVSSASASPSSTLPIGLPASSISRALSSIDPWASRTPGRSAILARTPAEKAGASESPSAVLIATLEVTIASVDLYDSS